MNSKQPYTATALVGLLLLTSACTYKLSDFEDEKTSTSDEVKPYMIARSDSK